ncbi:hypothetical protein sS8_4952 [Methylocaldum marinum]|uniref:Cyclic nucleotide-binding domain-containing protein n=2 Tax=Methylocaldum marinum TaxID=1432792 RepID=A0A250KZ18_9GAMM|nr:hypothetical protein sS8_4952 [Methylocaldum marinum]
MLNVHKSDYPSDTNMPPALSTAEIQELRRLIPLNTLSDSRFEQLCSQIRIDEAPKGSALFRQGDTKHELVYVLSGTISLQAGGVEMDSISGGTDTARFALAHQIPRKVSAIANDTVRYIRVRPEMINQQEELNRELPTYKVSNIPEEPTRDWMTALLKSPLFQRLPPANIQAILRSLEEIEVKAGDVICRQGDPGDFYYIIKKGRCSLSRKPSRLAKEIKLATLKISDAFGEDSLISGDPRNVTIKMLTDGILLRLDKSSFIKLLKDPIISLVEFESAQRMANRDGVWLDVRSPDSFEQGRLPGSLNIPFFSLRVMLPTLNRQSKYLLVCEDGRLSEAAAFLLIRYGFEAFVLSGGISKVPRDHLVVEATKWIPPHSQSAAAYSAPQSEDRDSAAPDMAADNTETPAPQEEVLPGAAETADRTSDRPEDLKETRDAFDDGAPGKPEHPEHESIDAPDPEKGAPAPTSDAPIATESKESRTDAEAQQSVARDSQAPEESSAATQEDKVQELEAALREALSRERNFAQRLDESENRAAEAVSRASTLEKQLNKASDIIANAAAITEQRQHAEEQLLEATRAIDALKVELKKARELASDREAALRSLQENNKRLLTEQPGNDKAENSKGEQALSTLKQEIERLKTLNRLAVRDKASAERQVADLTRQIAELKAADQSAEPGTADEKALLEELDDLRRLHAEEMAKTQSRLHDMAEEGNQLREALQSARTRLAVFESAAQATDEDRKKKLHFEFAVTLPVTLAITVLLLVLVLGGLFCTSSGRELLNRLLKPVVGMSIEYSPSATPEQAS